MQSSKQGCCYSPLHTTFTVLNSRESSQHNVVRDGHFDQLQQIQIFNEFIPHFLRHLPLSALGSCNRSIHIPLKSVVVVWFESKVEQTFSTATGTCTISIHRRFLLSQSIQQRFSLIPKTINL